MAQSYVHTGMIGLEGTKMSKSLGNLVFVHKLVEAGVDPSAIRLGVFSGHYREDRDWSDEVLRTAQERLERWRAASRTPGTVEEIKNVVHNVRLALADDLATPRAIAVLDQWAKKATGAVEASEEASNVLRTAVNSLLGVRL